MSDEQKAFVDALAARPGDEFTRLVYADWLDEHDKPDEAAHERLIAPGMMVIAEMGLKPDCYENDNLGHRWYGIWFGWLSSERDIASYAKLPNPRWRVALRVYNSLPNWNPRNWSYMNSEWQAYSAAAKAFAGLTEADRDSVYELVRIKRDERRASLSVWAAGEPG